MRRLSWVPLVLLLASLPLGAGAGAQETWPTRQWPTASPAAVGLDSAVLAGLETEIASGRYGLVDGMLVIRHGRIAWERSWRYDYDSLFGADIQKPGPLNAHDPGGPYNYLNPWWHPFYRRGELHSLQSVTKTVTSVIIGAAVARGEFPSIDTPVLAFFDTTRVANIDERKRRLTVRHLLTMTAGIDWNESLPYSDPRNAAVQMEASADWVEFTVNRPMAGEPGERFNYSSGASQLLSRIFQVATRQDIEEYAARHLFAPLGIERWFWKRTPTGLADTEGGLYLTPRDVAKVWYLFLRDGRWEGSQVVTRAWVQESVRPAVATSARGAAGVQYGLKWWLVPYGAEGRHAWAGSGFGGQIPIAVPEHDLVIVVTGWNVLPGRPGLPRQVILDRVLRALRP
jgi:CubicO group peptidase (beta-lactamase class C family)